MRLSLYYIQYRNYYFLLLKEPSKMSCWFYIKNILKLSYIKPVNAHKTKPSNMKNHSEIQISSCSLDFYRCVKLKLLCTFLNIYL